MIEDSLIFLLNLKNPRNVFKFRLFGDNLWFRFLNCLFWRKSKQTEEAKKVSG